MNAAFPSAERSSTLGRAVRRLFLTVIVALTLVSGAAAATLDDLRTQGYTVAKASDCSAGKDDKGADIWKTTWYVSGLGNSIYMSECDPNFAALVDNWADPTLNFERRWQHEHPDQLAAAQAIAAKCYSIGRAAPATDSWRILGAAGVDLAVRGADLPGLAGSLPDARAVDGSCTATSSVVPSGSGGSVVVPGALPVSAPVVKPPTVEAQAALLEDVVAMQELVETLEGTGNDAESIRIANAILG